MTPAARRTREETRELVVEAALDLVRQHGLGVEPTTISYQRVFDHLAKTKGVRVTRASVHERIWDSQEDFQEDVLLRVSRLASGVSGAAEAAAETLASSHFEHPLALMRELGRTAPDAVLKIAAADPLFYSWVGFTLSLAKDSSTSDERRETLADASSREYSGTENSGAELVQSLAEVLGVRPRRDLFGRGEDAFLLIARLGLALAEGVTVRMRFRESELADIRLNTGPNGSEQTWSVFAAGYWALLNTFLEIDPDAHPDLVDDRSD
jgi:hypothetical protein